MTTKQNDMQDEITIWKAEISSIGNMLTFVEPNNQPYQSAVYDRRANKPADNNLCISKEVIDDIATLKDQVIKSLVTIEPNGEPYDSYGYAREWITKTIDHLASRNLLKSEGVFIPKELIENIWGVIELSSSQMTWFANYTKDFNEETSYTITKCREVIKALRPFLPEGE